MAPAKRTAKGKKQEDGDAKEKARPLWDSDSELQVEDLDLSSGDEDSDEEGANEREIEEAVLDYVDAASRRGRAGKKKTQQQQPGPKSDDEEEEDGAEPGSDSEDDEFEAAGLSSGSEDEEDEEEEEEGEDKGINGAVEETGSESEIDDEDTRPAPGSAEDPASDSSEDERPNRNTVGEVPLQWYKDEEHVGYDKDGVAITKKGRRDALDRLLARNDSAKEYRTVYDEYNDEEIVLSKEEMRMIQRIRAGRFPHAEVDPFAPEDDWFSRHTEIMPLSGAPEPKRRFIPSKWEEKKVVKLVRAMRKGWLKRETPEEKPAVYMLWQEDGQVANKTGAGLTYIPAPKLKLPGHDESYNPPPEYLPSEEDRNAALLRAEEEGEGAPFLPTAFDSLRRVPAYSNFIKERFERCLDLYLCPRSRIKRLNIDDPESLVPKLPRPKDLQPFPAVLSLRYLGHQGPVRSLSVHPSGQWLLSGSSDGTVRMWEVRTARCLATWDLEEPVACVAWSPDSKLHLAAAAAGSRVLLLPAPFSNEEQEIATEEALKAAVIAAAPAAATVGEDGDAAAAPAVLATWRHVTVKCQGGPTEVVEISHRFPVKHVAWHGRGDYFCSVAPTGNTRAVLVHQLSRGASQNPFRKNRGRVVRAVFHPTKPFFFVATQQAVRVYNLAKQALGKKLLGGSGVITSLDIHPLGDHVIVGSEDRRLCWYDLDLSTRPYRALRYHAHAVRGAAFHPCYPLFASASDDGTAHVFHGMVYADLLTNPLIVPVKILRGHTRVDAAGVLDVVFHPTQPWAFTAGADASVCLHVNP